MLVMQLSLHTIKYLFCPTLLHTDTQMQEANSHMQEEEDSNTRNKLQ